MTSITPPSSRVPAGSRASIRALACAFAGTLALACGTALAQPARAPAAPIELAGVKIEPQVQLAGATLRLNGAGIRYRAVFKVYTAALYLQQTPSTTPEAVLAAAGPKRMHVTMLREIDANDLGKLFTKGMQDNSSREEFGRAIAGTVRIGEVFSQKKKLTAGETFGVDWVPGVGTTIWINGKPTAGDPIKEPEFFNALMRIWLGRSPADATLKDALLGKAQNPNPAEGRGP